MLGSPSHGLTQGPHDVDIEAAKPARNLGFGLEGGLPRGSPSSPGCSRCGLRILMRDLSYHVASNKQRGERAYLLRGVSAFLEPGQMTAMMGPSGSGKTTLLDLLAGRKTVGRTEGHLSFGGVKPTKQFLRRYTGYVEQFDTLLGDLTVREMLLYTAELKRPLREPLADKKREVDSLLRRLALDGCADVRIGDPMTKGISGGQAKRTNIGLALISSPRVLFLDEPTSGLDSFTANEVVKVVRGLVSDGTTIAATIHSPTAATFAMFDSLMLLVRGQLVYFGPQGLPALQFAASEWPSATTARDLMDLHSRAAEGRAEGRTAELGAGSDAAAVIPAMPFNAAEVLVEAVTEADQRGEAGALAEAYNNSQLRRENTRRLEGFMNEGQGAAGGGASPPRAHRVVLMAPTAMTASESGGVSVSADDPISGAPVGGSDAVSMSVSGTPSTSVPSAPATPVKGKGAAVVSRSGFNIATMAAGAFHPTVSLTLDNEVARELATRNETVTPWYWGLWILLKYRTGRNYRSCSFLASRTADKLVISLIILTVYVGIGDNLATNNLTNLPASLFMWALLPAFGAVSYAPSIVLERRLFVRERSDGLYRVVTYLAAKLVEELLLGLAITLVFSAYVFYGLQLRGQWVVFWLVYFLNLAIGINLAYLVAALSPNMDVVNAALPSFIITLLFFAGQLMTVAAIPPWWQWYSTIDFLRYAWGALMLNQFQHHDVEFAGGVSILRYYGLHGADKWAYIGYLALFWLVFAGLALAALTFVKHQKR